MLSPLQRLYRTKLALLATIATAAGIAMQIFSYWLDPATRSSWFVSNLGGLGAGLLGIGLLGVLFQYVGDQDNEERAMQRLRTVLPEVVPEIRDSVIQAFAFDADDLARVTNPAVLDQIARNVLALQLGDRDLADDVYTDLRNQVIRAPERWHDVDIAVDLTPWDGGPATGRGSMFVATLRWEYRVVPTSSTMRFACVSDLGEYRDLLRDQATDSAWHFDQSASVDAASRDAFELVQMSVDGAACPIRRAQRRGAQLYTATLSSTAMTGKPVVVAYTYRVLVQRHGHVLYLDLPRPTRGLRVQFNYSDAGIRRVTALDYFASSKPARIEQTPTSVPARSIDIGFDGWIFPRSGVAFVWVLDDELPDEAQHPVRDSSDI